MYKFRSLIAVAIAAVTISAVFTGCGEDTNKVSTHDDLLATVQKSDTAPQYDFINDVKTPDSYETYTNVNAQLAVDLLRNSYDSSKNTAICPAATTLSLGMLENGSSNDNQKAIKNLIGGKTLSIDTINQSSAYLTQRLQAFNNDNSFVGLANSFWITDSLPAKRSFLQRNQNFFSIASYKADFSDSITKEKINNLTADITHNSINNLNTDYTKDTSIYMVSASAVSDSWVYNFKSSDGEKSFTAADGTKQNGNFSYSVERYISTDKGEGFTKGLNNLPCRFVAIMPKDGVTMDDLIKSFNGTSFIQTVQSQPISFKGIDLPEFSANYTKDLKSELSNLGLQGVFANDADYSKLCDGNATLQNILGQGSIFVNANGVWGSKDTKDTVKNDDSSQTVPTKNLDSTNLVFDKPFIYAVVDNESGIPVIMGVVNSIE